MTAAPDARYDAVVLDPRDTVAVACRHLRPGPCRTSAGDVLDLAEAVPLGHKVARVAHAAGDLVVRAGMEIGEATERVPSGAWVHTHNLRSRYLPTFAHRGGER